MKILGRTLLILTVFALVMSLAYAAVNATNPGRAVNAARFGSNGERPPFPNGGRPEFRGDRHEFGGVGWIFGAIKNIAIVGVIVALVVVTKGWLQKRKRSALASE